MKIPAEEAKALSMLCTGRSVYARESRVAARVPELARPRGGGLWPSAEPDGQGGAMPIFIFLHVLAMFIAVALAYGPAALLVVATQRKDVRALRAISSTNERVGPLVGIFFGLGIVLGLVSVFVYGFDPLQGWLVIAYVLVVVSLAITFTFTSPWLRKVKEAADASPDDAMSPELEELLSSPRNRALLVLDALLIILLIADMVLKPLPARLF
jgi:hypothetical protein